MPILLAIFGATAVTAIGAFVIDNQTPDVVISQPSTNDGALQSSTNGLITLAVVGVGAYAAYKLAKR